MPLTAYRHLTTVTANTGRFAPSLVPASLVQFKYEYEGDFSGSVRGDFGAIPLEARFEVRSAAGTLLLAWGFQVVYDVLTFAGTFTYYAATQKVTVTFPTPAPTRLGSPDGIAEPGGGGGVGLGGLSFQETFESPIFAVAIPTGSTVKIVFHTAGFPHLNDLSGLSVRTQKGGAWISGFRHGEDGAAYLLFSGASGDAAHARAMGRERLLTPPLPLDWGADGPATVLRGADGTAQIAVYPHGGATLERVSANDGGTYGDAVTVYPTLTPLGVARRTDGTLLALLTDKSGAAFVGTRDRTGAWSVPLPSRIPAGVTPAAGVLLAGNGSRVDFFWPDSSGGLAQLSTIDDGGNWT